MSRKYGRRFCQRWPSRRAMASVRAKVKAITAPRDRLKRPMHQVVEELNPTLRGWGKLLPLGQLNASVHPDRQLRPPAPRAVRQQETRQERAALGGRAQLRLVP